MVEKDVEVAPPCTVVAAVAKVDDGAIRNRNAKVAAKPTMVMTLRGSKDKRGAPVPTR